MGSRDIKSAPGHGVSGEIPVKLATFFKLRGTNSFLVVVVLAGFGTDKNAMVIDESKMNKPLYLHQIRNLSCRLCTVNTIALRAYSMVDTSYIYFITAIFILFFTLYSFLQ